MTAEPATSITGSRLQLFAAFALIVVITVVALAQQHAAIVASMAVTEGSQLVAWLLAAFGYGTLLLRADLRAGPSPARVRGGNAPALICVTQVAFGLGAMSLVVLLLGVIGILRQPAVIAIVAVGDVLALRHIYNHRETISQWRRGSSGVSWLLLLVAPVFAIMLIGACVLPGLLWGLDDPSGYDVVAYHLQLPREWFDLGRVTTLNHNVFSFFPLNVEMHYLLAMHLRGGPWAGMYLAQMMHGSFVVLTIAAVYAAARDRGRLAASVAAIVCASVPWMFMLGSVAYVEGGLTLYTTLAAAWAIRGRWVLAGACAGLACGCKLTGVPVAIVIAVVCGSLSLWERARVRAVELPGEDEASSSPHPRPLPGGEGAATRYVAIGRDLSVFVAVALLVFSPWLIRTAIASGGNPIFPLALHTFGHGHFDAGQVERFESAHSPLPEQRSMGGRLGALWHQVGGDYHYGSIPLGDRGAIPLWLLLIVPAVVLARRDREMRFWLALVAGNVLVWLFATHLQGRFLVQVIPFFAMLVGCACGATDEYAHPCLGRDRQGDDEVARMRILIRGTRSRGVFAGGAIFASFAAFIGASLAPGSTLLKLPPAAYGPTEPAQLRELLPNDAVAHAVYDSDRPIALLGDAKAFWYAIPSSRLHYRSVFDVRPDQGFRDGWLGADVPKDAAVSVDLLELTRFYRTYRRLPEGYHTWDTRPLGQVIRVDDVPR